MKVRNIMNSRPVTAEASDSAEKAALLMSEHGIGAIPVTDGKDGKIVGIITDRDIILRCVAEKKNTVSTPISEIMSEGAVTVSPEHSLTEAARIMAKEQIRRLPVCENGKVVGIVSLGDISRAGGMFAETASAFCDICCDEKKE